MRASAQSMGRRIADALNGCWRETAEPLDCSAEVLLALTPILLESGAGGLAWRRVRNTALAESTAGADLKAAHKLQTIQAAVRELEIKTLFTRLAEAGIEPILVKGWAAARLYPEKGSRPQGDIDLIVNPADLRAASAVLAHPELDSLRVDLQHREFANAGPGEMRSVHARSRLVDLKGTPIRVLSDEDHLAFLGLHALRHAGWRPLWFCDIAAVLEARGGDFDWDLFLGRRPRRDWLGSVLLLANRLVGASLEGTPDSIGCKKLPAWLESEILGRWQRPNPMDHPPFSYRAPMASYLRQPSGLLADLGRRWPSGIEASLCCRAPLNQFPRFPFQAGTCLIRTVRFVSDSLLRPSGKARTEREISC